jgi:hypothetical protein
MLQNLVDNVLGKVHKLEALPLRKSLFSRQILSRAKRILKLDFLAFSAEEHYDFEPNRPVVEEAHQDSPLPFDERAEIFAIHTPDEVCTDCLRTHCFAFAMHRAVAKSFVVHRFDHFYHAIPALGLTLWEQGKMRNLRTRKERRRSVGTRSDARAATNARRGIHCPIRVLLGYQNGVGFRSATGGNRDITARLNDSVKSAAIYNQILEHRKRS